MLPPHLSAAHRPVLLYSCKPALQVLRQVPPLTALVVVGISGASGFRVHQQRRRCFFGRHRAWSSYLDPNFQRLLGRRQKALKHRYVEALHRKSLWDREPNRPSWVWKLSTSLGVPSREGCRAGFRVGGRWVSSDKGPPPQNGKGDTGGRRDDETRRERIETRMEEIRRMLDEDPFKALFGYRMRNLGRFPSGTSHEDFTSLLNWGKKSCAEILSRLSVHNQGVRNGMEEQARTSWKIVDTEGKEPTSEDPVQRELDKYRPQAATTDEFEFDPITMRRVPKKSKVDADPVISALKSYEQSLDTPEKTPEEPRDPMNDERQKYKVTYSWLEQEGFADGSKTPKNQSGLSRSMGAGAPSPPAGIPGVRDFEVPPEPPFEDRRAATGSPQLRYDTSESKVEDLDLLRPSDVRASAGILKSRGAETEAYKEQARELLENEFREATESEDSPSEGAKAIESQRNNRGSKDRQEATSKGDGAKATMPDGEGSTYDQTPQGFETCYDWEVKAQRAIIREARAGRYGETPQGLETVHTRDEGTQEQAKREADTDDKTPQVLQTSPDLHIKAQEAQAPEADIYDYETKPVGSGTPYVQEIKSQKEATENIEQPETWDKPSEENRRHVLSSELGELPTYQSDGSESPVLKLGPEAQALQSSRVENTQFIPRMASDPEQIIATESSPQFGFSARGNRNPKLAANKRRRQRDKGLIREIRSIYEDTYGPIDIEHRMKPITTKGPEEVSPDLQVNNALSEHDREISPNAYKHTGGNGLEAEILSKPQTQSSHESGAPRHLSPEELAMRLEEKEQILHEEVEEVNDLLNDVQSEFDAVKAKSSTRAEPSHPIVYKILAYDPSTNELTSGITTSSTDSEILPPSEVIPRLTHPAKFLPALTALKKDGYEIVSGGNDVLVFKRAHEGPFIEEEDPIEDDYHYLPSSSLYPYVNPIDGTTTGNFASPTGFVNHDAIFSSPFSDTDAQPPREPPPAPSTTASRPPSSSPTGGVKREEAVFSGQSKWQDATSSASEEAKPRKGRAKKAAKRVFWVGLWVAGCSYAVGVMGEFFRTGGAEGAGPQWFSGFH
ncbi:MAG: hypothetical protein M1840_002801 [Geoglossum simile]|nr:MAG: hypothetical protein M1840_002801 [Geoglossum simile]